MPFLLYRADDPARCGLVDLDAGGRVRRFVEKPDPNQIFTDLANGGVYIVEPGLRVEIGTLGDIPSTGSGLGSSSTVTVGLLHAMYAYRGQLVGAEQLAREACLKVRASAKVLSAIGRSTSIISW